MVLAEPGAKVFLDLKYHDIPNTVSEAVSAGACDMGVSLLNVHASGGRAMMEAAAKAAEPYPDTKAIAVTVLTSVDIETLHDLGLMHGRTFEMAAIPELVRRMARVAHDAGLDGVVCSAQEAPWIRAAQEKVPRWCDADFDIVCPAIRPDWAAPTTRSDRPPPPTQPGPEPPPSSSGAQCRSRRTPSRSRGRSVARTDRGWCSERSTPSTKRPA